MNPIIWKTALVFAVASVFGYWTIDYIRWLGIFEHPKFYHAPGPCRRLPGIEHGSEDIQVMENGLAFISSGLVLGDSDEYKKRVGRIYLFDYNHPDVGPQELKIIAKKRLQVDISSRHQHLDRSKDRHGLLVRYKSPTNREH